MPFGEAHICHSFVGIQEVFPLISISKHGVSKSSIKISFSAHLGRGIFLSLICVHLFVEEVSVSGFVFFFWCLFPRVRMGGSFTRMSPALFQSILWNTGSLGVLRTALGGGLGFALRSSSLFTQSVLLGYRVDRSVPPNFVHEAANGP